MADPATFLPSDSVLGPYFPLRTAPLLNFWMFSFKTTLCPFKQSHMEPVKCIFVILNTFFSPRWPRNSQRTASPTTSGVWSETTGRSTPSSTTWPGLWTAWAPHTCRCWRRTDPLCLSPAPSTTCQYLTHPAAQRQITASNTAVSFKVFL